MQVSFTLHELTTEGQYAGFWQILRTTNDIWTVTDKVCRLYEQPYYCIVRVLSFQLSILEQRTVSSSATGERFFCPAATGPASLRPYKVKTSG